MSGAPPPAFIFVGHSGSGKRSLLAALERLNVCYVDESDLRAADPGLRSFTALDTPEDVAAARRFEESE